MRSISARSPGEAAVFQRQGIAALGRAVHAVGQAAGLGHLPRLPERPPISALMAHWPE